MSRVLINIGRESLTLLILATGRFDQTVYTIHDVFVHIAAGGSKFTHRDVISLHGNDDFVL